MNLLEAFAATGGIVPGDELGRLLEEQQHGNFVSLAKMLVSGQVFAIGWRQGLWFPMFQFHPGDLSIRVAAQQVRAELPPTADGWSLAAWFAGPNERLAGHRPVDLLDTQPLAVMDAARVCSIRSRLRSSHGRAAQAPAPA